MNFAVKICGLTRCEDIDAVVEHNVDYIGIIGYQHSKRFVNIKALSKLLANVPPQVKKVAVMVNAPHQYILDYVGAGNFDIVQLHGQESVANILALGALPSWKAVHSIPNVHYPVSTLVVDNPIPGSGQLSNWNAAKMLSSKFKIMLSGGIGTENLTDAINFVHPFGVDLCSALESEPGIKSLQKIKNFFNKVKELRQL